MLSCGIQIRIVGFAGIFLSQSLQHHAADARGNAFVFQFGLPLRRQGIILLLVCQYLETDCRCDVDVCPECGARFTGLPRFGHHPRSGEVLAGLRIGIGLL